MSLRFLFLFLVVIIPAAAQNIERDSTENRRVEYYFQLQTGALIGCNACENGKQVTFTSSFNNGLKIGKHWRVGAGVGFDSYSNWNMMPVFISTSWDLFDKKQKNAFFFQIDYGNAIAGWKAVQYEYLEYGLKDTKFGSMFHYSAGYRIKYDQMRIAVGIGNKIQNVTSYYEYPTFYWRNNQLVQGESSRREIKNQMNRLAIWLAIGWK